jgi:hypothetical protein
MRRMTFLGGVLLWALAAGAEARDWGFSKDTVYASKPGGDTVWLVNDGMDTLKLDSVIAENINVSSWALSFYYQAGSSPAQSYQLSQFNPSGKMIGAEAPSGGSILFRSFLIGTPCPTAKTSESSTVADSIMIRLRFKSTSVEEDSLIVKGSYCSVSILNSSNPFQFKDRSVVMRDVLGRKFSRSRILPILKKKSE